MNTLRIVPRRGLQCLRTFTTSSHTLQADGRDQVSMLEALDPLEQRPKSELSTLLRGTSQARTLRAADLYSSSKTNAVGRSQKMSPREAMHELATFQERHQVQNQAPRRYREGDVYAPHDLSVGETKKWKKMQKRPDRDVFDMLGRNPMDFYKNLPLLSEFTTETGRIKTGKETGLRLRNQRRIAKAVRRAIGIGLMPSVYKHPELMAEKLGIKGYNQQS